MNADTTCEEAVVEWLFAYSDHKTRALAVIRAAFAEFHSQEALDDIEDQLVARCSGQTFDLGNGTQVTIGQSGSKPRMTVTASHPEQPLLQDTPQNESDRKLSHHV